jgi:hypothetical protein
MVQASGDIVRAQASMNVLTRSFAILCLLTWAAPSCGAAADPQGERNLTATSSLPQGEGFARRLSTSDLHSHPAVIFADDFETDDFRQRWDTVRDGEGPVLSLTAPPNADSRLGRAVLRVTASLEQNTGGGLTKWFESAETLFVRFLVLFDDDCDYLHHFVTLRANRGLQGKDRWSGFGGAGLRPQGDERFSTALEPWGDWGRLPPPGHWNFYSYWHEMEPSRDGRYWGNSFRPAAQPAIERGRWICAEFMLKHNRPGKGDGEQAYWIDGTLQGHWGGINWRKTPTLQANALTLETYVTDRWTRNPTNTVFFDNVIIAREYIGPP